VTIDIEPRCRSLDLSFKELERFVAVVEYGSLGEAAKTLGVTQQALGRSLTKLEDIMGAKLVSRSQGSQTRPTLTGEAFLHYAKSQLNSISQARHHVQSLVGARAGRVSLGIGETCDIGALSQAVGEFHESQPGVEISLLEDYTEPLLDRLLEGELDCVVGVIPDADYTRRGVVHELLYSIADIVVARAQHPLFKRKRLRLKDLQGYTWLVARRRSNDWAVVRDAFLAENLDPPQRLIRTDAVMVGTQLMLQDDYLFMVSPTFMEEGSSESLLKKVPVSRPTVTRHSGLMTMGPRQLNPATMELMNIIREYSQAKHRS
jgi:DNA-binding transcriptional LysR family regulator